MQPPLLSPAKPPAVFDPSRTYRYSLYREWGDPGNKVVFVMLNALKEIEAKKGSANR